MMLLETLYQNLSKYKNNTAFVIEDKAYTYAEFANTISAIQNKLMNFGLQTGDNVVVHAYDDIETYASIFAVWFSGGCFVPIDPSHPKERLNLIYNQIDVKCVITSNLDDNNSSNTFIYSKKIKISDKPIKLVETSLNRLLYVIFTSGSTGIPKGVPISLENLTSYITENRKLFPKANENSRFIQMYNLTFDASLQSYLLPLYIGASVYTVSPKKIKYIEVLKILQKHKITFAKISNTIINYLKPFYSKIELPNLEYCLFAGEALDKNTLLAWQKRLPKTNLINVYGPTEATVNTHYYPIPKAVSELKSYNGTVAIGKSFGTTTCLIVDTNNKPVVEGSQGELCLSGKQLSSGYWHNAQRNKTQFFTYNSKRYYKTGDVVFMDKDKDLLFVGRNDQQVKIQGYRIELTEVENKAKEFGKAINYVAISTELNNTMKIVLFSESLQVNNSVLNNYLKNNLPQYMLPSKIINLASFPLNTNGKIDRVQLKELVKKDN